VSVALVTQHAIRMLRNIAYLHLWSVRLYHIFPQHVIKVRMSEKKVIEHKMCCDYLYKIFLKYFSFEEEVRAMYV
jgi:hypothetical protein